MFGGEDLSGKLSEGGNFIYSWSREWRSEEVSGEVSGEVPGGREEEGGLGVDSN